MRVAVVAIALAGAPAAAMTGSECARDYAWSASETGHTDLEAGLVMWTSSWSAEGVYDDFVVVDCASGQGLVARARAERITQDPPFDRRRQASASIARTTAPKSRPFFRFETLQRDLDAHRVPNRQIALSSEPCACATYYPGLYTAPPPAAAEQE